MRQTKAERNARRRQLRWEKHKRIIDGYRSALAEMYRRAAREHWSHQRMMDYEREWISRTIGSTIAAGIGQVPTTAYEAGYIQGVKDHLWNEHWRNLTFCYRHPDKPWMYRPAHELCQQGYASRLCPHDTENVYGGFDRFNSGNHFYRSRNPLNPDQWADEANEYVDPFDKSDVFGRLAAWGIWEKCIPEMRGAE